MIRRRHQSDEEWAKIEWPFKKPILEKRCLAKNMTSTIREEKWLRITIFRKIQLLKISRWDYNDNRSCVCHTHE
jgi:hypothetical protein